ncbi:MAG: tRNA uridine-5-carboxymethylaminomethyl(34) synthesis enzyme MnmG [Planctomycetes bacterium]|nr:tRNA uridine-5-carboxymethylaminomethyl(34) synthesis enzyme MnmG [Planctomycetota bacterium]
MQARCRVLVVGGGHAGVEAAAAAARALGGGEGVWLVSMDPARIGAMSCNPAIGGLAKGQIVREVDALGGIMGLAADHAGIQFKVLNASKGPAVRGPRAQCDKEAYLAEVQRLLAAHGVRVLQGLVERIVVQEGRCVGVQLQGHAPEWAPAAEAIEWNGSGDRRARPVYQPAPASGCGALIRADAVVLTTGTFMRALMHTGESRTPGGRVGEGTAVGISGALRELGLELGRLKTGTPPRLRRGSIDWNALPPALGDAVPQPFSFMAPQAMASGRFPKLPQVECRQTHTTSAMHALIRANLHRAPMYAGAMETQQGPRYCPSVEDKVVRFADRDSHGVFLEPECLHTDEIYCNGISTSLPAEIQQPLVRAMPGCGSAEILRFGYAVEYDMVWPHQIDATAEVKSLPGLFLAGQINGTSGYEEAAAQGLVAGLNAAKRTLGHEPVRVGRDQGYIGVLMDDLVVRQPREPYRMFTSRAEHRLSLRADNADERLTPLGREHGLVCDRRWSAFEASRHAMARLREALDAARIEGQPASAWARRPDATGDRLAAALTGAVDMATLDRLMTDLRYEGYLVRQRAEIRRQRESEHATIPTDFDPAAVHGLRNEAREVIRRFRPATLGQASRLAGVNLRRGAARGA